MLTKIKTITSHVGLARFLAEIDGGYCGYLPRSVVAHIPSPYAYSPTKVLYRWNNRIVTWFETRHKHYEVFAVTDECIYSNEQDAEDIHIASLKGT